MIDAVRDVDVVEDRRVVDRLQHALARLDQLVAVLERVAEVADGLRLSLRDVTRVVRRPHGKTDHAEDGSRDLGLKNCIHCFHPSPFFLH